MRIFAAHGRAGPAYYRMLLPLGELGAHPEFNVTLKSRYSQISESDFSGSDVIVGQRIDVFRLWDYAGTNVRLVYEIDDDVFSILPENKLAYADFQKPEIREGTKQCLARSDLVTVPTEYLAEVMSRYNPNVVVLPNHVPSWVFGIGKPDHSLCVGWAGGASHARNVESVVSPVRRFLNRTPGWNLQLVGTDYRSLFGSNRSGFTPWTEITERPSQYYTALNFDIGLAPLLDNSFNRCKSPLRVLECAARGIPVVASDVTPYREFIEDGVTGFLVRHEHEWLKRISELAADEALREKMGAAARQAALKMSIGSGWQRWGNAYRSLSGLDAGA